VDTPDDQEPREMPDNPAIVDWIRCLSCGEAVRPVLVPKPSVYSSEGSDRYEQAVPCHYQCPACSEAMATEMRSFDQQMYGETEKSYQRFDVDTSWFDLES